MERMKLKDLLNTARYFDNEDMDFIISIDGKRVDFDNDEIYFARLDDSNDKPKEINIMIIREKNEF